MGLILIDASLKAVAFDHGAVAILRDIDQHGLGKPGPGLAVPQEILDAVCRYRPGDSHEVKQRIHIAPYEYICRIYMFEPGDGSFAEVAFAVQLERELSDWDLMTQLGNEYHLTDREQETLRGIAKGFATKDLAAQMRISPNTVKAFLRLIMIKMGVSTRGGILAKLREYDRSR